MSKKNTMGSDVVEGFECKPKNADPNKPIMFSAAQIFICDGERCKNCNSDDLTKKIRDIIKEMGYQNGDDRIKVTRTGCNGACRFRTFAYVYQNGNARTYNRKTCFSAWKNVHRWTDVQWKELISSIVEGRNSELLSEFVVEDKVYYEGGGH